MEPTKIAKFKGKRIRKTLHQGEWWFSVIDVVAALTNSVDPRQYIKKMRGYKPLLADAWWRVVRPVLMDTTSGRQLLNCANSDGMSQIIQFIRSPQTEPLTRWLAKANNRQNKKPVKSKAKK